MVSEAVILAGGMGTRLGPAVKDVPKPMVEVSGRPFLEYLLDYIIRQNIKRAILAVGFKHGVIKKHFGKRYKGLELIYSVEEEPLGTGGAIKKALGLLEEDDFFILNGDTYFNVSLAKLYKFHKLKRAALSLALKPLFDFSRYGTVDMDVSGRIVGFREKGYRREGMINGGVYILKRDVLSGAEFKSKFSFEKDFLEKYSGVFRLYGLPFADSFFIDIGVPEDYARAQDELKKEAERVLPQGLTR
jgi:D-glycero-alpha-D-manno-heptose 1-phosphate guanylyltransferase